MDFWKSIVLGLLQGATEFLPVSSSGHLVLMKHYLNFNGTSGVSFEVVVHAGTLLATLLVYRCTVVDLLRYTFWEAPARIRKQGLVEVAWRDDNGRLITLLVVGSVPTALLGLFFKDFFESLFNNVAFAGMALVMTGLILYSTKWIPQGLRGKREYGPGSALLVGLAQGLSITPGISRSGVTISTGMWRGLPRGRAADFSFLLSMPAIFGAFVFKVGDLFRAPGYSISCLACGFVMSLLSGYIALRFLLGFVKKGKIHVFSWYCWGIGLFALAGVLLGKGN